jgi:peptide/nickel transport system ATP-binding protein
MPPILIVIEEAVNADAKTPLLSVRDLRVSFALDEGLVRAVDGTSFDVMPGQVLGIVGESGCGKSVTMKAILQLVERPGRITSGEIRFRRRALNRKDGDQEDGGEVVDLAQLPPRGALMRDIRGGEIALIPQEPMAAFSPVHTVGDQVIEAILLHSHRWQAEKLSRREARDITVGLFRDVGISMPEQRVDAYSWPTTAIDVTTQAQVLALLRDLQAKYNTAIIFITHDLGVIAQMASYVVVMYLGRVMEQGPVDDIFHVPKHPYTKALLRSIPSLYGETRVALPVISGSLPHPFNRPAGCPFHPRCPQVMERCSTAVPSLQPVNDRQLASCFLYNDTVEPA